MTTAVTATTSKINGMMVKGGKIIMLHTLWCNFYVKFSDLRLLPQCKPTAENLSFSTDICMRAICANQVKGHLTHFI